MNRGAVGTGEQYEQEEREEEIRRIRGKNKSRQKERPGGGNW